MFGKAIYLMAIILIGVDTSFAAQPQAGDWVLCGIGTFEDGLDARIFFDFVISDNPLPQNIEVGYVTCVRGRGDPPEFVIQELKLIIDAKGKVSATAGGGPVETTMKGVFDSGMTAYGTWQFGFLTGWYMQIPGEGTWTASHMENLTEWLATMSLKARESAARALGGVKDKKAVQSLIVLLEDKDEDIGVREEAAKALGRIKDEEAIEPLAAALNDKDVDFRWMAREDFGRKGTMGYGRLLSRTFAEPGVGRKKLSDDGFGIDIYYDISKPSNNFIYTDHVFCVRVYIESKDGSLGGATSYTMDTSKDKYGNYQYIYAFKYDEKANIIGTNNITVSDPHDISKVTCGFSDSDRNYMVDRERSVRQSAAWALAEMRHNNSAKEALVNALKGQNLGAVAGAYRFFLETSMLDAAKSLVKALEWYGDKAMAEDFLDSGNSELQTAAQKWLEQHK